MLRMDDNTKREHAQRIADKTGLGRHMIRNCLDILFLFPTIGEANWERQFTEILRLSQGSPYTHLKFYATLAGIF